MDDRFENSRMKIPMDRDDERDKEIEMYNQARETYKLYSEYYGLPNTDPKINEDLKEAWKIITELHEAPDVRASRKGHRDMSPEESYEKCLIEKFSKLTPEHGELHGKTGEKLKELGQIKGVSSPCFDLACEKYDEKIANGYERGMGYNRDSKFEYLYQIQVNTFIKTLDADSKLELIPKTAEESREIACNTDFIWRDTQRTLTGFVNINMETMDRTAELLEDKKCLEVMAGNGLFSRCLQDRGIDILATDKSNTKDNEYLELRTEKFTDIKEIDAIDAIREYGKDIDVLIMSWPPYGSDIAARCAEELYNINPGAEILYIGEGPGGCTADDDFFNKTEELEWSEKLYEVNESYTPYYGVHDSFHIVKYTG